MNINNLSKSEIEDKFKCPKCSSDVTITSLSESSFEYLCNKNNHSGVHFSN